MNPDSSLISRSAAETVGLVPYLLGFHPHDSLVVVGFIGRRVMFGARYDLPPPGFHDLDTVTTLILRQRVQAVFVLGYGPPGRVTPAVLALATALRRVGLPVLDVVRVTEGRWWSYMCGNPSCCPPEGNACRPEVSPAVANAVYQGRVALPSRAALAARVAPVEGTLRVEMTEATERARTRLAGADDPPGRRMLRAGHRAVREAERRAQDGRPLTADEAAWLGVLLTDVRVFDYALERKTGDDWWIQLWIDVLRHVEPRYVPAPACLVGYVAWRVGDGPLARVAIDRALLADPSDETAIGLDQLLNSGLGPHALTSHRPPGRPMGPTGPGRQRGGTGGGRRVRRGTHRRSS